MFIIVKILKDTPVSFDGELRSLISYQNDVY